MPLVKVYNVVPIFYFLVVYVVLFTSTFVSTWTEYYEQEAEGTIRTIMTVLQDTYQLYETVTFGTVYLLPKLWVGITNLSPTGRVLVLMLMTVMIGVAIFSCYLRITEGDVQWEFQILPDDPDLRPHPGMLIRCEYCDYEHRVYPDRISPFIGCPRCRAPLPGESDEDSNNSL